MGFVKKWDVNDIQRQLRSCAAQVNSEYNDGFTAWTCKQDLLNVKYQLDELLRSCPTFADESEYIASIEKHITWKRLSENSN